MIDDINQFAAEVHALAVEKGFYDPPPTEAELIAAIHSEVSEAFDAWNNDEPMVWHECLDGGDIGTITGNGQADCDNCACKPSIPGRPDPPCPMLDFEPHGIAVELIDVVLRILDAAAAWKLALRKRRPDSIYIGANTRAIETATLPEIVRYLHRMVSQIDRSRVITVADYMSIAVGVVFAWLHAQGIDPEAIMREKHAYNVHRPYKHGGKKV